MNLLRFTSGHAAERHRCRLGGPDPVGGRAQGPPAAARQREGRHRLRNASGRSWPTRVRSSRCCSTSSRTRTRRWPTHKGERGAHRADCPEPGGPNVRLGSPRLRPRHPSSTCAALASRGLHDDEGAPGEGTGLGLWVSYSIVEQHQGSLQSRQPSGRRRVFIVELRPHRQCLRALARPLSSLRAVAASTTHTLLVRAARATWPRRSDARSAASSAAVPTA
mgnify:CR=1 FL=1